MDITLRDIISHSEINPIFIDSLKDDIFSAIDRYNGKINNALNLNSLNSEQIKKEYESKISKKGNELIKLEEFSKFLNIINRYAGKIFSTQLLRMPSLFIEDRDIVNQLKKEINDLLIFLDCNGLGICFDHHGLAFTEKGIDTNVATSEIIDFIIQEDNNAGVNINIEILQKLLELNKSPQLKNNLLNAFKSSHEYGISGENKSSVFRKTLNSFIPITDGYLDSDAVLSHFSLLFPKSAKKHQKLIDGAAVYGDLNLESSNKSKNLNNIIEGLREISNEMKKNYKNFLETNNDINKSKKEIKDFVRLQLAIFDTVIGNAMVRMVPEMIKFLNGEIIDQELFVLFSTALNNIGNTVDNKTDKISDMFNNYIEFLEIRQRLTLNKMKITTNLEEYREKQDKLKLELGNGVYSDDDMKRLSKNKEKFKMTQKNIKGLISKDERKIRELFTAGLIEVEIIGGVIYFFINKKIEMSINGIPPQSFYQYIRGIENINLTDLRYCVICLQGGNGEEPYDFKESDNGSKGIFISNIPHSRNDLKTHSLRDKIYNLNNLEILGIKNVIEIIKKRLEELELGEQNNKTRKEIILFQERLKSNEQKLQKYELNGSYHVRNGFIFMSSGHSPINGIVEILNSN